MDVPMEAWVREGGRAEAAGVKADETSWVRIRAHGECGSPRVHVT